MNSPAVQNADLIYELAERLASGEFKRVAVFCGSIVSRGLPSSCPTAPELRSIILQTLLKRPSLEEFITKISPNHTFRETAKPKTVLEQNFYTLPFEQFMGCLYSANSRVANNIVRASFGQHAPNKNHETLAAMASIALEKKLCRQFTIFTTNYDPGLEDAFEAIGRPLRQLPESQWLAQGAPTYTSQKENEEFQLVKLHGSVDHERTLAFTFTEITKKIAKRQHFKAARELIESMDLLLFIGYGLNDFDLRPVIQSGLMNSNCITLWNDRPENSTEPSSDETGQNIARDLLRKETGIITYKSDLFSSDESASSPNIMLIFANALGITSAVIPPFESLHSSIKEDVVKSLDNLTQEECVSFLANIADSCSSADAVTLVQPYAAGDLKSHRRRRHVSVYIFSLAHVADYAGPLNFVENLVKSKSADRATKVIALGQGALICTLAKDWRRAFKLFLKGYLLRLSSWKLLDSEENLEFDDNCCHFWLRGTGYIGMNLRTAKNPLPKIGKIFEISLGLILSIAYRWLVFRAGRIGDLRRLGSCTMSLAESLRFARMLDRAKSKAEEALQIHTQIQELNAIIMSERIRAWIYSAEGSAEGLTEARQSLARATILSSRTLDPTLLQKCAKELTRVVLFECEKQFQELLSEIQLEWSESHSVTREDVGDSAKQLSRSVEWDNEPTIQALSSITAYLASQCREDGKWLSLCEEMKRLANVHHHPRQFG